MAQRLVIVGAGGHARDTFDVVEAAAERQPDSWDLLGFVSEVADDHGRAYHGSRVLGGFEWFAGRRDVAVVIAIGDPEVRARLVARAEQLGLPFATLVHPAAVVSRHARVGPGCIVSAGVMVTSSASIGAHVILNLGCTVAHDAVVADCCTLAPGVHVNGHARLGSGCDLGAGAVVLPKVAIGAGSVVGAGAVVIKDLPAGVTAVGVPARIVGSRPPPG
jgi:sugar O-acyltransferase (sialic acid O-acetyltransferase NeuD family)